MKLLTLYRPAASLLILQKTVHSFAPTTPVTKTDALKTTKIGNVFHPTPMTNNFSQRNIDSSRTLSLNLKSTDSEEEEEGSFLSKINLKSPYTLAYGSFILLAAYMNNAEAVGASQALIEKFISDPLNPGVNELFTSEFNLLGLIGLPMACLIMPGAKNQPLPATPFLFGSSLAGYGSLGIYMSTRKSPAQDEPLELGTFTKNVLENKIFNWLIVAAVINTFFVTGAVPAFVNDSQQLFSGYIDVISSSALGFVSTVDLTILCLTAASLIPEDLERRGVSGSETKAIAASTLLLPVLGLSLYCALRPSLPEVEE